MFTYQETLESNIPSVKMELKFHASHALFYLAASLGAGVFYVSEESLLSCRWLQWLEREKGLTG